ncbi:MAG: acyl-CoA dehydrogenase [Acidimicrobiia bacterium]|nr:acyl-CoA dehydrogenase [Acidimicrobiia bacterium]
MSKTFGSADVIDHDYVKLVEKVVSEEDFFAHAARNDRESRYPFENMAALKSVGVPSMAIHPQFGGPGHNIATRTKVAEAIAYGDPVSAACTNMHWSALDLIGPYAFADQNMAALLRDCAENQSMFCGAASAPSDELDVTKVGARFRRVDGGWLGGGRVGFATNSAGATYVGTIASVVDEQGELVGRKLLVMFVPVGTPGMIIHDDWNAMGLRGTATNSVTIENAFVPDKYAMVRDLDQPQATFTDDEGEVQHMAFGLLNLSGGGMQVGHCRRILAYMAGYLRKRKGGIAVAIKGQVALTRADVGWAQSTYGRMSFWVRSASTVLYDTAAKLSDPHFPQDKRAWISLMALYHVRRMTEEVARESFRLAGAHGIVAAGPYERMYRDLLAQTAIIFKAPEMEEHLGKAELGMDFDPMPGG